MKNLVRIISFVFAIVLFTNLFTSCKKDADLPTPEVKTETLTPATNVTDSQISMLKTFTEVNETETDSLNLCDCFDLFSGMNWDATDEEIATQLEVILNSLTESEIEALLTPVCTVDGEFFPNACIAECNGVTNYDVCDDDEGMGFEDCFTFEYPITVVFPDNSTAAVNSDEELVATVETWYDANLNVEEDPTLEYPVNAILVSDGTTVTVNSDDELEDLFDICDDDEGGYEDCFTFVFPLTIQFPDSTTAVINSMEEGEAIVDAWYDANPDSMEDPTFVFPIQVTLEDGTVQVVNNEEELDELFEDCYGMGGCFLMDGSSNALTAGVAKMKKF